MTTKINTSDLSLSFVIGVIGGSISGVIIMSADQFLWVRSTSGFGIWDWGVLGLGIMYGGFFGLLMGPLGYIIFLRNTGIRKAIVPAFIGTILGGCIGTFSNPACALFSGCIGFLLALAGFRLSMHIKGRLRPIKQT